MDRVRVGIVGVGNISVLNVPGYLEHPKCDVVALCDSRLDLARARAAQWGVPKVYGDLEEILADAEVDAVEILTPTYMHAEHVMAAARAGKHISCQKPIANSVAEARAMIAACAEAGVVFRVTENCCYYPPLQRMRQLVTEGVIGTPNVIRIKTVVGDTESEFQAGMDPEGYAWRFDSRSPGGHLFDDVMHKYAMAMWLVDQDVTRVQAVVRKGRLFFEAPMVALFEYDREDLLGCMEVSHAPGMFIDSDWYGADEFFEIQGTEGLLWVTRLSGRLHDMAPLVVVSGRQRTEVRDIDDRYEVSFRRSAAAFVEGLLSGSATDLSPETALRTLQLAFAVYKSSAAGEPVELDSIEDAVSPPWWPKTPAEIMEDVIALGLLPPELTPEEAMAIMESLGSSKN
ncbi:MAG TPA: Gfo/Idh/MocA family oxidoreductase [Acidimicrobiales bacterium]|nr:Gfo/Idh/MocA family oxidoreductase [Acidimicrobiales bacterium]